MKKYVSMLLVHGIILKHLLVLLTLKLLGSALETLCLVRCRFLVVFIS